VRFVDTIRRELLDRTLILNERRAAGVQGVRTAPATSIGTTTA